MSNQKDVAVVGLGYIGSVIGAVLADQGARVIGIEKSQRILDAVAAGRSPFNEPGLQELIARQTASGRLTACDRVEEVSKCATVLITVGTPLDDEGDPDVSQIRSAVEAVAPHLRDGTLVILKSTVPPFTTEQVVAPILAKHGRVLLAFCPERLAEGRAIEELKSIPVVVGGVDEASGKAAAAFWKRWLGVPVIEVRDARTAEMVKLADNLWIDLNIALAGELAKLSDKLGIDVLEVIEAANSLPKVKHHVNILIPSVGVGGYCLTKDPWFVQRMGGKYGLELQIPRTSRTVNDSMPEYSVSLIDGVLLDGGRKASGLAIAVMGIAFKNNTGDCRYTPTKPVLEALQKRGYRLRICDPWVAEHDRRNVTDLPVGADIEAALQGADAAAFLTGHREFHDITMERLAELLKPGALVFDGRMFFSKEKIKRMKELGLVYKGVGR